MRYSVRFLVSYVILVNTIDILSNSNGYSTMLPVKKRLPNCDFRAGQITTLWALGFVVL